MPLNGSGTFSRVYSWVTDRNAAVKIQAARMDTEFDGIATALSNAMYRDGQATPTASIPMGGQKITGLGDATLATDALNRQAADARYMLTSTAVADLAALLDEAVHAITVVASATTCDIGAAATDRVSITGTTTITSLGTGLSRIRFVTFTGALILTYNATSLILPTSASITTAAVDAALFSSDSSGNWTCLKYQRRDGSTLAITANQVVTASITDANVTTAKILDNNVTLAKLATQAASTVLANVTAGVAVPTAATVSAVLDLVPGTATKGDLIVRDTALSARIAAGTATYVLTSNGAGALPTYQAAANTGWEKISATTIGAAVANLEQTFTVNTYAEVLIVFSDISGSAAALLQSELRTSTAAVFIVSSSVASVADTGFSTGQVLFIIGRNAATKRHYAKIQGNMDGTVDAGGTGVSSNASAPDRVKIFWNSGNIDAGIITIYGLKV